MFNVFIYEFSIGMGPIVFSHKGKDGIDYNFRALPIGGYVSMAGEVYEDDSNEKIPKDRFMCNRPWWQRLIILCAGVFNNFVLALVLLFTIACIWGGATYKPIIAEVQKDSAAEQVGLVAGDRILKINGKKVSSWEVGQILLIMKDKDGVYDFSVKHKDGKIEEYHIKPNMVMDKETKKESPVFGIAIKQSVSKTLW
jgi:regulator of sigma E protease